jgi:hypothetical protein
MALSAGLPDIVFMDGGFGIIMQEDIVSCMAVVTLGKFSFLGYVSVFKMDVFSVLFLLFRVAAGTVDLREAFPEMDCGVGVDMTLDTRHPALPVDIPRPLCGIHKEGAQNPVGLDLVDIRPAMAGQTVEVSESWNGLGKNQGRKQGRQNDEYLCVFLQKHTRITPYYNCLRPYP